MLGSGTCLRRAEQFRIRRATGLPPRRPAMPRRPPRSLSRDLWAMAASALQTSAPTTCPISPFLPTIPSLSETRLLFLAGSVLEAGRQGATTMPACFPERRTGRTHMVGKSFGKREKKSVSAVPQMATTSKSPTLTMRERGGNTFSSYTTEKIRCSTKTASRKGRKRTALLRRKMVGRLQ